MCLPQGRRANATAGSQAPSLFFLPHHLLMPVHMLGLYQVREDQEKTSQFMAGLPTDKLRAKARVRAGGGGHQCCRICGQSGWNQEPSVDLFFVLCSQSPVILWEAQRKGGWHRVNAVRSIPGRQGHGYLFWEVVPGSTGGSEASYFWKAKSH